MAAARPHSPVAEHRSPGAIFFPRPVVNRFSWRARAYKIARKNPVRGNTGIALGSTMQELLKRTVRTAGAVAVGAGLGYPGAGLRIVAGGRPEGGR